MDLMNEFWHLRVHSKQEFTHNLNLCINVMGNVEEAVENLKKVMFLSEFSY
jgi:hypothetical protein